MIKLKRCPVRENRAVNVYLCFKRPIYEWDPIILLIKMQSHIKRTHKTTISMVLTKHRLPMQLVKLTWFNDLHTKMQPGIARNWENVAVQKESQNDAKANQRIMDNTCLMLIILY